MCHKGDSTDSWDSIFIGGLESGVVTIVDYNPQWATRYEEERIRISSALGQRAMLIEHIGSTAVPGLAAKPIIDILVFVDGIEDEARHVSALEIAGYVLRVREPGHRMLRTVAKDVHVHLWDTAAEVERHVRFRDWLRTNEADRRLYERTKRELATMPWNDTNEYAQAKDKVVAEITNRISASRIDMRRTW